MDDRERVALAERALGDGSAEIEACVSDGDLAMTRFTRNAIHQNLGESSVTVQIRAVVDGRAGVVSTNARDDAALKTARDDTPSRTRLSRSSFGRIR